MIRYLYISTILIFALFRVEALAQSAWELDLDSITVTTSRLDLPANRMGKLVTIIDASEIRRLPANSVDEILRFIPGIEMQLRGPSGAQGDVTARASTFNQVLILLDGIKLNDPLTGHFSSYLPIPVSSIERIEILRGPAAAQYGSEAVGAVINIITSGEKNEPGISFNGNGMIGENNWNSWDATLGISGSDWEISLGSQRNKTDGHVIDSNETRSDLTSSQFTVAGEWRPSDKWRIGLRGAWDDRDFAARYFYTTSPLDESREIVKRRFSIADISFSPDEKRNVFLRVGYQVTTDSFRFNPMFTGNFHTTELADIQAGYRWGPTHAMSFHVGTQVQVSEIESNDRGDHDHFRAGGYVLSRWYINQRLNVHGGLRLEYDKIFEWSFNPQIAVNYEIDPRLAIRAFAGKGIRAADFTERFISTQLPVISGGRNLGNPDLAEEKSWSFELGIDKRWPAFLLHRVTVFHRRGEDLIDYILTPGSEITNVDNVMPDADYFYAQNISRLNTTGLEYMINLSHQWKKSKIEWNSGISFVKISGAGDTPSKYIANNSNVLWQNTIAFRHKRSSIVFQHLYKLRDEETAESIGANLSGSYHLVNFRLSHQPFGFIPLSIIVQVDNLLDERYSDILGAQMPGRWVKGGLRLQF